MKAKLTNLLTGDEIIVHSTTEHPDSSYGHPVWVDDNNICYGQVDLRCLLGFSIEYLDD